MEFSGVAEAPKEAPVVAKETEPRIYTNAGKQWSEDDYETLERLLASKRTIKDISKEIGRTYGSISSATSKMIYNKSKTMSIDKMSEALNIQPEIVKDMLERYIRKFVDKGKTLNDRAVEISIKKPKIANKRIEAIYQRLLPDLQRIEAKIDALAAKLA